MGTELAVKENEVLDTKKVYRSAICKLENFMSKIPGAEFGDCCPLKHSFGDGIYIREINMPKGMLITSKIHKLAHPYFILKGDVTVLTEDGEVRIKAPFKGITPSGTKRALYIHEDTTWITVHVTKETDLEKIEEEIIAKNFKDLGIDIDEAITDFEEEHLMNFIKRVGTLSATASIEEKKDELK